MVEVHVCTVSANGSVCTVEIQECNDCADGGADGSVVCIRSRAANSVFPLQEVAREQSPCSYPLSLASHCGLSQRFPKGDWLYYTSGVNLVHSLFDMA